MVNDRKIIPITCILLVLCFNASTTPPENLTIAFPFSKVTENRNLFGLIVFFLPAIFQGLSLLNHDIHDPGVSFSSCLQTVTKQQVEIHDFHQDKDLAARPILGRKHDMMGGSCVVLTLRSKTGLTYWVLGWVVVATRNPAKVSSLSLVVKNQLFTRFLYILGGDRPDFFHQQSACFHERLLNPRSWFGLVDWFR